MRTEDPEIEISAAQSPEPLISPRPSSPLAAVGEVGAAGEGRDIFLHLEAIGAIVDSLPGQEQIEVGGLLVGRECEDEAGVYLLIAGAIPARQARGTSVSVTFTHETWNQLSAEKASRYPAQAIVGWYHTHPGLGVFLSERDLFIHRNFFADSTHIAVVIDPSKFAWGIFYWQGSDLVAAPGCYIYGEPAGKYERLSELLSRYQAGRMQ